MTIVVHAFWFTRGLSWEFSFLAAWVGCGWLAKENYIDDNYITFTDITELQLVTVCASVTAYVG